MAEIREFPKPQSSPQPLPPLPPAASARQVLTEKRICRVTFRLSDTLKSRIENRAHELGQTISDYLVHLAAMHEERQAEMGRTRADIAALRRALDLLEAEEGGELTAPQRLWIMRKQHNVSAMVLAGRRAA